MARNGTKTGGKNFVKGQSGNPAGRPPMPKELQNVRKLSPSYIKIVISKLCNMGKEDLEKYLKDNRTPMVEITIGAILVKATAEGDYSRLNFLLDRSIGKVKDNLEITIPKPTIIERLDGSQMQLGHDKPKMIDAEYEDESDS